MSKPKEKPLSAPALRALKEAQARRDTGPDEIAPTELGGRDGPEPTRFGDWEKKGLTSDF